MLNGKKNDQQKPRIALLPPLALLEVAKVFTFGAEKYDDENWRGGFKWRRLMSASFRHSMAWLSGETYDKESGIHHLAHAIAGLLMLIEFSITKTGEDDRYIYESNKE